MTEERQKCWICGFPQPDWPESLHSEDCAEHEEENCIACRRLKEKALADDE